MTVAESAEGPVDRFQLVGTVLENKFRVDRLVAEGGFGIVYQGHHVSLERAVAIKVLKTPSEFNDEARRAFMDKFQMEAKTIARISHPNIVHCLDYGVGKMPSGDEAPWMVLEWLTGKTLEAELEERRGRGGRTPAEALVMLRPVLEAVAYAHDEGIAHRDLKPANIMVVQTKRGATLRLMDFGIAKLMDANEQAGSGATRTRSTMNAFSPQYAAPEQLSGTRTGPWTDVHALGLIMSEVLTDCAPYEGEDMTALFVEVLAAQRPSPAKRGIDVGSWEPILQKGLAVKPDERYKNAGDFLTALDGSVAGATKSRDSFTDAPTLAGEDGLHTTSMRSRNESSGVAPLGTNIPSQPSLLTPMHQLTTQAADPTQTHTMAYQVPPQSGLGRNEILIAVFAVITVMGVIGGLMAGRAVAQRPVQQPIITAPQPPVPTPQPPTPPPVVPTPAPPIVLPAGAVPPGGLVYPPGVLPPGVVLPQPVAPTGVVDPRPRNPRRPPPVVRTNPPAGTAPTAPTPPTPPPPNPPTQPHTPSTIPLE